MELYGSLSNISGSVTASAFTGSFIGDGSGLTGIQAAGVTGLNLSQISTGSISASLSPNGFNVNTDTSITGSLKVSGNITAEQYNVTVISSSVLFQSGSSKLGDTLDDTHQLTGSVNITGSISLNGEPIGTGKLNETTFQAYTSSNDGRVSALETSSGSLNSFTSSIDTTIKNKLNTDGVISGSSQILNGSGIVSSSTQVTAYGFATTGSNLFIGTQTHSGSILPSVDNAYDLGSETFQWRDVYISSGSLYIDGTKVLSSTAQELTITTDNGQSIKILEGTTDSIILQTADGDIELKSSADGDILLDPTNGKIMLKGPIEVFNGNKIQSSVGGTPVVFANDIVVSGSIELTGTIDGIDLTAFSSSLNGRLGSLESSGGSLNSFTSSAIGRLNALETTTSSLNTYTSSNNTRLGVIEGTTSSLNTYTSSADGRLSSIETTTGSILSVNTTQNGRLDSLETTSGSILSANTTQNGRLDSIEGKTGSYATTGSNIFQGNQIITGSLFVSQDLIIAGSSSIQNISSSVLNIADNIITVNAVNPSVRFGGLEVIDSGSSPLLSGSILFDSVNDQWVFVHQNQGTITSSVVLMGPETFNNLGNEGYITANRLPKGSGIEHLRDSNISDNGTTVTILSNAVVNGTFSATGTTLVSGSSQISHDSTTGYVANRHIDHTSVSISAGNGLSGGGDISTTRTLTLDTSSATFTSGVKSKMNADGVVSGSSQVSFNGITDKPTLVSGSSQITYGSLSGIPSGIVSGSSQITFGSISGIPGGLVSGSSQIDLTATTNYSSGIKTRLNAEGVISGSSQVTGIGNAQLTNSSFHIGTTSISLGRSSASQTLTGVSIDGNAATATSATSASSATNSTNAGYLNTTDLRTISPSSHDAYKLKFGFTSWANNNSSPYADYLHLRSYSDGSGGSDNLVMFLKSGIGMRIYQQTFGSGTAYSSFVDVYHTGNLTNLNQLTNGPGYITALTDTLATVTSRGAITTTLVTLSKTNSTLYNANAYNGGTGQLSITSTINSTGVYNGIRFAGGSGSHEGFFGTVQNSSGLAEFIFQTFNGSAYGERTRITSRGSLLHGHAAVPSEDAWLGTAVFGRDSYNKVIIGSLQSTTTGAYIGGHNSALNAWADLNIAGEALIFRYQQTERARFDTSGHFIPGANNSYNLGSSSLRWANLYTNDLHLSNEGKEGGNEIDGTTGDWTIQEGEENLYIINNKNGKKFKIDLTEIV